MEGEVVDQVKICAEWEGCVGTEGREVCRDGKAEDNGLKIDSGEGGKFWRVGCFGRFLGWIGRV